MDKRFLQTILICFAISFIYMDWITPDRQPGGGGESQQPIPSPTPQEIPAEDTETQDVVAAVPGVEAVEEQNFFISNPQLMVEITNRGASVVRAALPDYHEEVATNEPIRLLDPEFHSGPAMVVKIQSLGVDLSQRLWEVKSSSDNRVSFRTSLGSGRAVVREYHLPEEGYELENSIEFEGEWSAASDTLYEILGAKRIRYDVSGRAAYPNQWIAASRNRDGTIGEVERRGIEAVELGEIRKDEIAWVGLESNYFAQVLRPVPTAVDPAPSLGLLAYGARPGDQTEYFESLTEQGIQGWPLQVGFRRKIDPAQRHDYTLFLGPKAPLVLDELSSWNAISLIDYGFFGWLVRPFLWLLRTFDGVIGSWGLSIILLTFCIRGVLHPVNKKNQRQMQIQQQGMARLKPQMDEIKEKYKNDAPLQQRKIQELFRKEGVNPAAMFGGCLFIFLQLPIWLALIQTFTIAIELRQASFLWVDDLTRPDMLFQMPFSLPFLGNWFNLLPLVYVIVTLINQKMMPKSEDPQVVAQQKMMSFMMIGFGFIFYSFAAGLMVYFITSALVGIVEQKMIRKDLKAAGVIPASGSAAPEGAKGPSGPGTNGPARPGQGKVHHR